MVGFVTFIKIATPNTTAKHAVLITLMLEAVLFSGFTFGFHLMDKRKKLTDKKRDS